MNNLSVLVRDLPNKFEIDDYLFLFSDENIRIFYDSKNKDTGKAKEKIIRYVNNVFYETIPKSMQVNKMYFDFLNKLNKATIEFI